MKTVVISVGGSAINPKTVDTIFLKGLKKVILKASRKNKIIICTGGGFIARDYIQALKDKPTIIQNKIGITCTRLNAQLVANTIGKSNQEIPISVAEVRRLTKRHNVVVCGGMEAGTTSDGTTATIAKAVRADVMINMTNVKGLYSKDPRKYKDAKFIRTLSHKEFKRMVDAIKEKPGQHFVLDRLAANICRKNKIKVVILKGVANLSKYLDEKKFAGTIIS